MKTEKNNLYFMFILLSLVLVQCLLIFMHDMDHIIDEKSSSEHTTQFTIWDEKTKLGLQPAFINTSQIFDIYPDVLLNTIQEDKLSEQLIEKIAQLFESASVIKNKDLATLRQNKIDSNDFLDIKRIVFQGFVIGSLFIIAVNHLVVFLYRRKELSAFFLSLACLGFAIRLSFVGEFSVIFHSVYQIKPESILYVDLISGLIAILFYYLFIDREFNPLQKKYMTASVVGLLSIYIASIIILPLSWSIETFFIYQILCFIVLIIIIYFSFRAVRHRQEGSYMNIAGLLILFLLLWNDVYEYSQTIPTEVFIFLGALIYLSILSIHLSRKSSHSFESVERLSEELQVFNDQLESKVNQRTKELQTANETLHKIEKDRQRLLGNIAHELNTPLTFVKSYTKAMLDEIIPRDDTTYLRQVDSETKIMTQMIKDLQEVYKLESNQVTFQFQRVNIREFLVQSYESQKVLFKDTKIDYRFLEHISEDSYFPFCLIDPIRIRQVINNLIVNARKFTDDEGVITMDIEIPSKNNQSEITVKIMDTGRGISEKDKPFIFDRFYKVERAGYSAVRGSGLGLAVVKEIMEAHKGIIKVNSKLNVGSTFYFTLPIDEVGINEVEKHTESESHIKVAENL